MADKAHPVDPRFARPSEGGEGFVCKVCGKPAELKHPAEGKAGGFKHTAEKTEGGA